MGEYGFMDLMNLKNLSGVCDIKVKDKLHFQQTKGQRCKFDAETNIVFHLIPFSMPGENFFHCNQQKLKTEENLI